MRVTESTGTEGSGGIISRSSFTSGHPHSSASKLPVKARAQFKSLSVSSGHAKPGETLDACSKVAYNGFNSANYLLFVFTSSIFS